MLNDQLENRYQVNKKAEREAIFKLRSLLEDGKVSNIGETPNSFAVNTILRFFKIKSYFLPKVPRNFADVEDIFDDQNIFTRKIRLEGTWWRETSGPILAFDRDGNMVTLLPKWIGYERISFTTGKGKKINKNNISDLQTTAYAVTKGMPRKSLTFRDFKHYCISTIQKRDVALVLLLCTISTLLTMLIPVGNKLMFSEIVPSGNTSLIYPICALLISATISRILFELCKNYILSRTKDQLCAVAQPALMHRLLSLPSTFFKKYSSGDLGTRVLAITNLYQAYTSELLALIATGIFSLMYIFIAFIYAKSMIWVITCFAVISFVIIISQYRSYSKRYINAAPYRVKVQDFSYNAILGIQKIKNYRAEHRAFNKWADNYSKSEVTIKYSKLIRLTLIKLSTLVVFIIAIKSKLAISDFVAFSSAFAIMQNAAKDLMTLVRDMADSAPYIEWLDPLLEAVPENRAEAQKVTDISGSIEINHVSFRYSPTTPKILDDVTLHIPSGQNVALVGASGCGKSTLMRLMLGFEKCNMGSIYYGEYNIDKINLGSLRQYIGFCPQSMQIFPGTIASNIRFATENCTEEDLWKAVEIASLDEDIKNMPDGMETMIGEGGSGLSGGQCQRLLIARSVVSKPKVLFLDEATSALDNITQKRVIDNLNKIGCTRIAIAHRLSTVMDCDRIIVLDKGKIIEDGTPQELFNRKGLFYQLSIRQQ